MLLSDRCGSTAFAEGCWAQILQGRTPQISKPDSKENQIIERHKKRAAPFPKWKPQHAMNWTIKTDLKDNSSHFFVLIY
jgi:hypothetical protein